MKPTDSDYLAQLVGLPSSAGPRKHASTKRRDRALKLAVVLPCASWALTAWLIARQIFGLGEATSAFIGAGCAGLSLVIQLVAIYVPASPAIVASRVAMGLMTATLASGALDLVVFGPEGVGHVKLEAEQGLAREHEAPREALRAVTAGKKADWENALTAANLEMAGAGKTKVRNGPSKKGNPVWHELDRQATQRHDEYLAAMAREDRLAEEQKRSLDELKAKGVDMQQEGVLSRIEALHRYVASGHPAALVVWALFAGIVVLAEMSVVLVKGACHTVDDRIETLHERVSEFRAQAHVAAATAPPPGRSAWAGDERAPPAVQAPRIATSAREEAHHD